MIKPCKVVLCGTLVFVVGMQVSLRGKPDLDVARIDGNPSNLAERLNAAQPDAIIFDLTMPQSERMLLFLKEHPAVRLIGLDLTQNAALVMSGQLYPALSADDLAQIIQEKTESQV